MKPEWKSREEWWGWWSNRYLLNLIVAVALILALGGCMQGGDTSIYTDSGGGTATGTGTGGTAGQEQG